MLPVDILVSEKASSAGGFNHFCVEIHIHFLSIRGLLKHIYRPTHGIESNYPVRGV
jgi:hypothetical protein